MGTRTDTVIRAVIAAVVIAITFGMTYAEQDDNDAAIPKEWEAIVVLVIGYYFADRPATGRLHQIVSRKADESEIASATAQARFELLAQFIVALLLVAATASLFTVPRESGVPRSALAAAWIAGVGVAVGFFFKNSGTIADDLLAQLRGVLAILIVGATLPIVFIRELKALPVQWITVVAITIGFYFKERSIESGAATSSPRRASSGSASLESALPRAGPC